MPSWTQPRAALACVLRELDGGMSRREVKIAAGYDLVVGSVLGRVTETGRFEPFDPNAADGTETPMAVLLYATNTTDGEKPAIVIDKSATLHAGELEWHGAIEEEIAAAIETLRETSGILVL